LPAESNDKFVIFSIDLREARNGRGQCCSRHELRGKLIPLEMDKAIILAMTKERTFLRNDQRVSLSKENPHSDHNRGRETRL
jgi:hypothetical protein